MTARPISVRLAAWKPLCGCARDFLVALAVDMPAMTAAFLRLLLEKAGSAGVVPRLEGFYHGAVAVYPIKILPLAEQVLAAK